MYKASDSVDWCGMKRSIQSSEDMSVFNMVNVLETLTQNKCLHKATINVFLK